MRFIVVHAAATPPSMDIGAEWIDRIHRERGFRKIGYHYVIRRDGTIETGRSEEEMGAHTKGWNRNTLGVCLVGGIAEGSTAPEDNFTQAQFDSLDKLLIRLHEKYPEAEFRGHRDFPNHTSRGCPCFDHLAYFQTLKIKLGITKLYAPLGADTILEVEEGNYPDWDFSQSNK